MRLSIYTFALLTFDLSPLPIAKFWLYAKLRPRLLIFQFTILLSHKKFLFRKFLMTSLDVIFGLLPHQPKILATPMPKDTAVCSSVARHQFTVLREALQWC